MPCKHILELTQEAVRISHFDSQIVNHKWELQAHRWSRSEHLTDRTSCGRPHKKNSLCFTWVLAPSIPEQTFQRLLGATVDN